MDVHACVTLDYPGHHPPPTLNPHTSTRADQLIPTPLFTPGRPCPSLIFHLRLFKWETSIGMGTPTC